MQYCATSARQGCQNRGGVVAIAHSHGLPDFGSAVMQTFSNQGGGAYYVPRIFGPSYGPTRWPTLAMDDDLNWSGSQWGEIFFGTLFQFLCVITRYFFQYYTFVWLYVFFINTMSRKQDRYRNWRQLQKRYLRNFFPQLIPIWINWWSYEGRLGNLPFSKTLKPVFFSRENVSHY